MNILKQLRIETQAILSTNRLPHIVTLVGEQRAPFRVRTLAIEATVRHWENSQPLALFKPRLHHDIIEGQDRSDHYGQPIGTILRSYRMKRDSRAYDKTLADYKHQVWIAAKECKFEVTA